MANRRFIDFPIAASVGDNDIVLIWQDGLNKQTTKATLLQGSPQSLAGLTDVDIAGLTNGQILQYNSTLGKWENVDRTDINLSELGDVTIVAPTNGQVLVYNSSTSKWENSSGGYVPYTGAVTTVNLGAQSILAGSFVKAGGTSAQFLKADGSVDSTAYGTGSVTSVGLTMPSAFNVANSPVTTNGTLAVTGAGTVSQYIRGDGSLADFPATTGGGASVSYYLNGSVSQGTIGGVAYREVNRNPVFGAGTDISISSDGYIASFITDAGDPNKLEIPAGNWNLETYFSASSGGGNPSFYVELYKYNGLTFTLIASSATSPELIAFGTNLNPYFSTLAVPQTTLSLTDRLALRYYVNTSGRTITLHTENNHLCQVITTFTTGLTALNGLTTQVQFFAVGTSGTDFAISSATDTHTFNLPTASATNRGALSSADWSTFNGKQNALGYTPVPETRTITINGTTQDLSTNRTYNVGDMLLNTYQAVTGTKIFDPNRLLMAGEGTAQPTSLSNTQVSIAALTGHNSFGFNSSNNIYFNKGTTANGGIIAFSNSATRTYTLKDGSGTLAFTSDIPANPVGGTGTTNYLPKFTGTSTIGNSQVFDNGTNVGIGTASPSQILDVQAARGAITTTSTTGTNTSYLQVNNTGGSLNIGIDSSTGGSLFGAGGYTAGVWHSGAYPLTFGTSNTERMRLTSGGNLLVGTTTDAGFKLDVNGTGRFSGQLTSGSTTAGFINAKSFLIGTDGTETNYRYQFYLDSNDLKLYSRGYGDFLTINYSTGAATFSSSVTAKSPAPNANALEVKYSGNNNNMLQLLELSTGTNVEFNLRNSSGTAITRFNTNGDSFINGGNVGIGTNSPTNPLHIVSNNISQLNIQALSGNTNAQINFEPTGTGIALIGPANNVDFAFRTNATERMRITSGGNVVMGNNSGSAWSTSSTRTTLEIYGGGFPMALHNSTSVGNSISYNTYWDGTNWRYVGASSSVIYIQDSEGHKFFFNGSGSSGGSFTPTERMRITSGGNVLIGTTTDGGQRLQVNGAIKSIVSSGGSVVTSESTATNGEGQFVIIGKNSSGTTRSASFKYDNADLLRIGTSSSIDFRFETNDTERMRITSGGNLLIGTSTNGASKLRISGLPTSSSGLSSGDIWNDSGTLKIA